MIPEAAVEAAAKQMAVNDGGLVGWVLYQADAQKVLEAAAPHIATEAWSLGLTAGIRCERGEIVTNPYR